MSQSKQPAAHTPAKGSDIWHNLKDHLSDVAEKAGNYAAKFHAFELGYYAGLWHDLGKYNPEFQEYLELCHRASKTGKDAPSSKVPHAIQGARLAWEKFMPLAPIIYGHHGGLPEKEYMKSRLQDPALEKSYQEVLQQAPESLCQLQTKTDLNQLMSGLVRDAYGYEFFTRFLFSCLIDADHLDTESHFHSDISAKRGSSTTITELWDLLQKRQKKVIAAAECTFVNQIRADVYHACVDASELSSGIFRLAVPTGGGKTFSNSKFKKQQIIQI